MKTEAPVSLRIMETLNKAKGAKFGFRAVRRGETTNTDFEGALNDAFILAQMVKITYGPTIFIEETGKPATFEGAEQLQRFHAAAERMTNRILNPAG